jgi:cytochrome c biogenesis protein CcdA/thiol-disulfide isomerase/thioredoxin
MLLLIGVAFAAGVVTALSPCVLPVLPIVFAGGAVGGPRRPYAIVAGIVVSFTVFTLVATALLAALGLPGDLLRNLAIAAIFVVAVGLLWPEFGEILTRPFLPLARLRPGDVGGGFVLGLSLGLVFSPCAGPVIGAVATLAAAEDFGPWSFALTFAFALGKAAVLLPVAIAARRGFSLSWVRARAPAARRVLGALVAVVAVLMLFGIDKNLQTKVPEYTRVLQGLERSAAAQTRLRDLTGARDTGIEESELRDFGAAPDFRGIELWINSQPLTLEALRGKVVLVDFWTYSCVNCLRTLPHVRAWYDRYRDAGLVVVGVHTPEFSFEREADNVRGAVRSLEVRYPVALDPGYETWNAWGNRFWPAKYFIDRRGHVRFAHFGEGAYEESEQVIRTLLAEPSLPRPVSASIGDRTPEGVQTPETYLGYERIERFVGSKIVKDREATYRLPETFPFGHLAYGGRWTVEGERIVAGERARLQLSFHANAVFLVLGTSSGEERVAVRVDGRRVGTVRVTDDRLYRLARIPGEKRNHVLDLSFSPGTEAYAFTFG